MALKWSSANRQPISKNKLSPLKLHLPRKKTTKKLKDCHVDILFYL